MNKVKILFFSSLRDFIGERTIEADIPVGTTVRGLTDLLVVRYPKLESVKSSMIAAVNREFASDERVLSDAEEIAFFPPVSGG